MITDTLPKVRGAKIFDPTKHCLGLLDKLDYRKICGIVDAFDAIFWRGDNTLTKESGLEVLAEALEGRPATFDGLIPTPDKKSTTGQIWAYGKVQRLMRSPVLSHMLSGHTSFKFRGVTLAHVSRDSLGEFDARATVQFLIASYKGNVIIPKYGSYFHHSHLPLIRDGRLTVTGALYDDAVLIAKNMGLVPATTGFNDFVATAMG